MKIVQGFPPNIEVLREKFNPGPNAIFTYGDTVYNPSGGVLSPELRAHEAVHIKQQEGGAEAWWDRYLVDVEFRLEQELAAHRVEYQTYCKSVKDRNKRSRFLNIIAVRLASPMYGGIITSSQAARRIASAG